MIAFYNIFISIILKSKYSPNSVLFLGGGHTYMQAVFTLVVIVPSPSLSNSEKASLNSDTLTENNFNRNSKYLVICQGLFASHFTSINLLL